MLKRFFDMNNPLMQGLSTAAYLMILNLMAVLFSLPIVTAGAALIALHDVTRQMVRNEESYPAIMFIRSFRENLKEGVIYGLIFILGFALVVMNYFAAAHVLPPFRYISIAIGILMLSLSFYTFALAADFKNSVFGTLKNALMLMIGCFPQTLGMTAFTVAFILAAVEFTQIIAPLLIMFGIALPVYVSETLLRDVLKKFEMVNEDD